jgi:hypothetical protein
MNWDAVGAVGELDAAAAVIYWKWAASSYSPSFVAEVQRISDSAKPIPPTPPQVTREEH